MRAGSWAALAATGAVALLLVPSFSGTPRDPAPEADPRAVLGVRSGSPRMPPSVAAGRPLHGGEVEHRADPEPASPEADPGQGPVDVAAPPPFSDVAHRVWRTWGGEPGPRAPRELQLVVEPGLGTAELERLLRDAVAAFPEADVLTIRIYDSEAAVSYDRHTDGGALAERHLVASMSRHRRLGVESLRVRGVELER